MASRITPTNEPTILDGVTPETAIGSTPGASRFSGLEEIPLMNGDQQVGVCYRSPEGRRAGVLPVSGVEYEIRPKRVRETIEIEKAMGGSETMMGNIFEMSTRTLTKTITKWGNQTNVTRSQIEDLFDEDFEHLMLVLATFRTAR